MTTVDEKIGRLIASVESLKEQSEKSELKVNALLQTWQIQDNLASEAMHELQLEMAKVTATVEAMHPTFETCRDLIQNAKGGIWVLGVLGSIALAAVGFMLRDLWAWASALLVRPH